MNLVAFNVTIGFEEKPDADAATVADAASVRQGVSVVGVEAGSVQLQIMARDRDQAEERIGRFVAVLIAAGYEDVTFAGPFTDNELAEGV